jgi:hypothetical protein
MEGKTRGRGQVAEIALTQMNRPHPPGKRVYVTAGNTWTDM